MLLVLARPCKGQRGCHTRLHSTCGGVASFYHDGVPSYNIPHFYLGHVHLSIGDLPILFANQKTGETPNVIIMQVNNRAAGILT